MKKRIFAALCAILLILSLSACAAKKTTCTLTIACETALTSAGLDAETVAALPSDGYLLPATEVEFTDGESVLEVLRRTAQEHALTLDVVDGEYPYVNAIGPLAGGSAGPMAGWLFSVNGEYPSVGAADIKVQAGDAIVFSYTCDGGADLGIVW